MLRLIALCCCLLVDSPLAGMIRVIDSVDQLRLLVEQHDEDSLFIFDVDQVLLVPGDTIALPCHEWQFEKMWDERFGGLDRVEARHFLSIFFQGAKVRPVEKGTADFVRSVQERGIRTMALTSMRTGYYGVVASMERLRQRELAAVGVDFSSSFPHSASVTFDGFGRRHPVYFEGIAMADHANKGEVLDVVLDHLGWLPKRVVYLDDRRGNLLDVKHVLHERGIKCEAYHYIGAFKIEQELDEELAKKQFEALHAEQIWLRDEEVTSQDSF